MYNAVAILKKTPQGFVLGGESDVKIGERAFLMTASGHILHTSPVMSWRNYNGNEFHITTRSGSVYYIAVTNQYLNFAYCE